MFCEYCKVASYKDLCQCKITGKPCGFVRRCLHDKCWKPLDYMTYCKIRKEGVIVPKGKNRVRFEMRGILYVDVDDFTYEIKNPYDYTPNYVEVTKVGGEYYIKGFEPKKKTEEKVKIIKDSDDTKDEKEQE